MIRLVDDYTRYVESLKSLIKDSKYKTSHFLDELGMPKASFYRKLRENRFSVGEVQTITKILYPEEAYKKELLQAIEKGRKDIANGNTVTSAEMRKAMREKIESYQ